jgi:hypothetical protein
MTALTEKQLPFKVYRHDRPKITYGKAEEKGDAGRYEPETNTIVISPVSRLEDKEWLIEHEIAHYQLDDREHPEGATLEEVADGEMKAELLTHARLGRLQHRVGGIQYDTIWDSIAANCMQWLEDEKISNKRKQEMVMSMLARLRDYYKKYIPQKWLEQYNVFVKEEEEKRRLPPTKIISNPTLPIRNKTHGKQRASKRLSNPTALISVSRAKK